MDLFGTPNSPSPPSFSSPSSQLKPTHCQIGIRQCRALEDLELAVAGLPLAIAELDHPEFALFDLHLHHDFDARGARTALDLLAGPAGDPGAVDNRWTTARLVTSKVARRMCTTTLPDWATGRTLARSTASSDGRPRRSGSIMGAQPSGGT